MFRSGCLFTVTTLDGFVGNAITLQVAPTDTFANLFQFECLNCEVENRENQIYEMM